MLKKHRNLLNKVPTKLKLRFIRGLSEIRAIHKKYVLATLSESEPVFILGVQKSGTTAIAALLADATGLPATLDITRAISRPGSKFFESTG